MNLRNGSFTKNTNKLPYHSWTQQISIWNIEFKDYIYTQLYNLSENFFDAQSVSQV